MELQGFLLFSQQLSPGPYPEPDQCIHPTSPRPIVI
jgi:hypothetical protein